MILLSKLLRMEVFLKRTPPPPPTYSELCTARVSTSVRRDNKKWAARFGKALSVNKRSIGDVGVTKASRKRGDAGFLSTLRTMIFGSRDLESDLNVEMLEELHMITGCELSVELTACSRKPTHWSTADTSGRFVGHQTHEQKPAPCSRLAPCSHPDLSPPKQGLVQYVIPMS